MASNDGLKSFKLNELLDPVALVSDDSETWLYVPSGYSTEWLKNKSSPAVTDQGPRTYDSRTYTRSMKRLQDQRIFHIHPASPRSDLTNLFSGVGVNSTILTGSTNIYDNLTPNANNRSSIGIIDVLAKSSTFNEDLNNVEQPFNISAMLNPTNGILYSINDSNTNVLKTPLADNIENKATNKTEKESCIENGPVIKNINTNAFETLSEEGNNIDSISTNKEFCINSIENSPVKNVQSEENIESDRNNGVVPLDCSTPKGNLATKRRSFIIKKDNSPCENGEFSGGSSDALSSSVEDLIDENSFLNRTYEINSPLSTVLNNTMTVKYDNEINIKDLSPITDNSDNEISLLNKTTSKSTLLNRILPSLDSTFRRSSLNTTFCKSSETLNGVERSDSGPDDDSMSTASDSSFSSASNHMRSVGEIQSIAKLQEESLRQHNVPRLKSAWTVNKGVSGLKAPTSYQTTLLSRQSNVPAPLANQPAGLGLDRNKKMKIPTQSGNNQLPVQQPIKAAPVGTQIPSSNIPGPSGIRPPSILPRPVSRLPAPRVRSGLTKFGSRLEKRQ